MEVRRLPFSNKVSTLDIVKELNKVIDGYVRVHHYTIWDTEPTEKKEGTIVFADGVEWNPGSGPGMYVWRNGVWKLLVSTDVVIASVTFENLNANGDVGSGANQVAQGNHTHAGLVTNGDSHNHSGGDGAQIDHTTLSNIGTNTHAQLDVHVASTSNPHATTGDQVLPPQTGNSGKVLGTNGVNCSWVDSGAVTNGDLHDHSGGDGAQINHTTLSNIGTNTHAQIDSHIASTSNPHNVTAAQVGAAPSAEGVTNGNTHDHSGGDGAQINHTTLSNIGTNTHAQIDTFIASKAAASGIASLDSNTRVPDSQLGTGTPDSTKFLRGDRAWAVPPAMYCVHVGAGNLAAPADEATYYFGSLTGLAPQTSAGNCVQWFPKAGTVKAAYIRWYATGTAGSGENISIYIRCNSVDTLIETKGTTGAAKIFSNAALNLSVAAGDSFEIKVVCPTWATNPTNVQLGGVIYVE